MLEVQLSVSSVIPHTAHRRRYTWVWDVSQLQCSMPPTRRRWVLWTELLDRHPVYSRAVFMCLVNWHTYQLLLYLFFWTPVSNRLLQMQILGAPGEVYRIAISMYSLAVTLTITFGLLLNSRLHVTCDEFTLWRTDYYRFVLLEFSGNRCAVKFSRRAENIFSAVGVSSYNYWQFRIVSQWTLNS